MWSITHPVIMFFFLLLCFWAQYYSGTQRSKIRLTAVPDLGSWAALIVNHFMCSNQSGDPMLTPERFQNISAHMASYFFFSFFFLWRRITIWILKGIHFRFENLQALAVWYDVLVFAYGAVTDLSLFFCWTISSLPVLIMVPWTCTTLITCHQTLQMPIAVLALLHMIGLSSWPLFMSTQQMIGFLWVDTQNMLLYTTLGVENA